MGTGFLQFQRQTCLPQSTKNVQCSMPSDSLVPGAVSRREWFVPTSTVQTSIVVSGTPTGLQPVDVPISPHCPVSTLAGIIPRTLVLQLGADIASPEATGYCLRVGLHTLLPEVPADVLYVTSEEHRGVPVRPRVDGLREVDYGDLSMPVEDVVGRQVGMNPVPAEEKLDVLDDLLKQLDGLELLELCLLQLGRSGLFIADELHEDDVGGRGQRPWDAATGSKQQVEYLVLMSQPGPRFDPAAPGGLFLIGTRVSLV